jgi:hypothetical protein
MTGLAQTGLGTTTIERFTIADLAPREPGGIGREVMVLEPPEARDTRPVLGEVLAKDRAMSALFATHGTGVQPVTGLQRFLDKPVSWSVVGGAAAALASSPLTFLVRDGGLMSLAVGAAAAVVLLIFQAPPATFPAPLALFARNRPLKRSDVAFLETPADGPLQQTALQLLAQRWIRRINDQRIGGHAAFDVVEKLADAKNADPATLDAASAIVGMFDVLKAMQPGASPGPISTAHVDMLIARLETLPRHERDAARPLIAAMFFKGEKARTQFDTHEAERKLYRAAHQVQENAG